MVFPILRPYEVKVAKGYLRGGNKRGEQKVMGKIATYIVFFCLTLYSVGVRCKLCKCLIIASFFIGSLFIKSLSKIFSKLTQAFIPQCSVRARSHRAFFKGLKRPSHSFSGACIIMPCVIQWDSSHHNPFLARPFQAAFLCYSATYNGLASARKRLKAFSGA